MQKKKKKNTHGKETNKQPSKECPPQSKTQHSKNLSQATIIQYL
jgi:hypothetical protein